MFPSPKTRVHSKRPMVPSPKRVPKDAFRHIHNIGTLKRRAQTSTHRFGPILFGSRWARLLWPAPPCGSGWWPSMPIGTPRRRAGHHGDGDGLPHSWLSGFGFWFSSAQSTLDECQVLQRGVRRLEIQCFIIYSYRNPLRNRDEECPNTCISEVDLWEADREPAKNHTSLPLGKDSFLAAFASLQFSQPKCKNWKRTEIGGTCTEHGGKSTEICGDSTAEHLLGEVCTFCPW